MAFFEKIGGAITSGVGATANKAKDITDQSKLSSEINSKKKEVKEIYTSIGKLYVEGADEAKLLELKNNALELKKVIDALEEKYNDAKGLKKCELCGEVIDNASVFCAHCGGKQTTRVNKCVKCRTVLADGVAFCFNCGTKQPDLNAVASAPVVEQPAAAPVVEEPVVAPVVEEPVVAEPAVEEAVIEEVAIEEPAVEEAVIEEVAVEEPAVEEAVIEEVAVEEPAVSETEIEDIDVEDAVIEPVEDIVPDFVPAEEVVVEEVEEVAEAVVEEVSATIKCASCGAELDDDSAFCTECGTPVNKVEEKPEQSFVFCTNCGNKEDAGTKFCSECGTKL